MKTLDIILLVMFIVNITLNIISGNIVAVLAWLAALCMLLRCNV